MSYHFYHQDSPQENLQNCLTCLRYSGYSMGGPPAGGSSLLIVCFGDAKRGQLGVEPTAGARRSDERERIRWDKKTPTTYNYIHENLRPFPGGKRGIGLFNHMIV